MQWLTRNAPGQKPVLDAHYLHRLEIHLGEESVTELLADGIIELIDRLERLERLARAGDRDRFAALGHDLIAVAGHLGLSALSIAAVEMQRRARAPDSGDLMALARPVLRLAKPSANALDQHLESLRTR